MAASSEPTDFLGLVEFFAAEFAACTKKLMAEANDPDCDPKKKSHVLRLCRATLRDFDLKREILTRVANHLDK